MHTRTLKNIFDRWEAWKGRWDDFSADARFASDPAFMRAVEDECAETIARIWRWAWASPAKERAGYAGRFREVSSFAAEHYPLKRRKGWPMQLRLQIFLARHNTSLSLWLAYRIAGVTRSLRG